MKTFSTEAVCAITGSHPACIRRWSRAGLISVQHIETGWKIDHIGDLHFVANLASSGATLDEIRLWQRQGSRSYTYGWPAHRGELLWQLEYGSSRTLARVMRRIDHNYCGDDYINRLLRPLNAWLREDTRSGAARRITRFHEAVMHRAHCVMRYSERHAMVPLLLEAVTVSDETDIWLEAIRLTREGFDVDVAAQTDEAVTPTRSYEHHLLWCSAGISGVKHDRFRQQLEAGQPVRLCGPDTRITPL